MTKILDFLQGASNAAASNVSAPIDGLAWLLRKMGADVGTPMGGSDWMRQKGLTAEPKDKWAGLLGESVGGLAPIIAAAKAPQIASGLLKGAENLAAPRTMNPQTGAVVWHGSPHKFDKFDSAKIGTGEGAQAYGHGLYLADNPSVARGYQDRLSGNKSLAGIKYDVFINNKALSEYGLSPTLNSYIENHGSVDGAIKQLSKTVSDYERWAKTASTSQQATDYLNTAASWKPSIEKLQALTGKVDSYPRNNGSLYKVDLPDEQIAKMLDWDKPLSGQSAEVQAFALKNSSPLKKQVLASQGNPLNEGAAYKNIYDLTGQSLINAMGKGGGAEDALRQSGIPGIRYLDGDSRAGGASSSNYVVFPGNEGLLSILERNGKSLKDIF